MQSVLSNVASDSLRVYIVWIPALPSDHREDALEATTECVDSRARHFWDRDRVVGDEYKRWLGISKFAWDVYFVYERGAVWTDAAGPPEPHFWTHQLRGLDEFAPMLDSAELSRWVVEALQ